MKSKNSVIRDVAVSTPAPTGSTPTSKLLYIIHYTLYIIHYTLYIIHYTLYIKHYTLYIIHYTLYNIHYTNDLGILYEYKLSV